MSDAISPLRESVELANTTSACGQVCDRCRLKKIKCNAASPCDKCLAAGTQCTVSATLRRRTTARGFSTSAADAVKRLESENASLWKQLEAERQANAQLREELKRKTRAAPGRKRKLPDSSDVQSPLSVSYDSVTTPLDRAAYVVKHMGRLVRDHSGIGRFAGSTTGVHFVLSVQDACRSISPSLDPFPEPCYNSHLLQPTDLTSRANEFSGAAANVGQQLPFTIGDARDCLNLTLESISRHLHLFDTRWSSFCPVVIREETIRQIRPFFADTNRSRQMSDTDYAVLLLTLLVTRISVSETTDLVGYSITDTLIHQIYLHVSMQATIWSLQALIVYALFIQKKGERLAMIPLNGVMVRIAQSLGLHRHARRFKFEPGNVELRKRIWWSVYTFDKLTSIAHGLPQLISNTDVDNDLPIDCILQDSASTQLLHPLPGEPTSVSIFCHYVGLNRILSKMLAQLYTTTDRRGGAAEEVFNEKWPLKQRVELLDEFEKVLKGLRQQWSDAGRPPCESCKGNHPQPCHPEGGKFLIQFRKKAGGVRSAWAKEQGVEDPANPEQSKGKKKRSAVCKNCARGHPGGMMACKAPICAKKGCGLGHFETESCVDARKRFIRAGLIAEEKSTKGRLLQKADVAKGAALFDALNASDMGVFGQILQHKAGEKRKAEEDLPYRPSKAKKGKKGKKEEKEEEEREESEDPPRRQEGDKADSKGVRGLGKSAYANR